MMMNKRLVTILDAEVGEGLYMFIRVIGLATLAVQQKTYESIRKHLAWVVKCHIYGSGQTYSLQYSPQESLQSRLRLPSVKSARSKVFTYMTRLLEYVLHEGCCRH